MKKFFSFIILFILLYGCVNQTKEKEKNRDYVLIANYIDREYIQRNKRELQKLTEDQEKWSTSTLTFHEIQTKQELIRLWEMYHKVYLLKNQDTSPAGYTSTEKTKAFLQKITTRYEELTGLHFPDYEAEFYGRYGKKRE